MSAAVSGVVFSGTLLHDTVVRVGDVAELSGDLEIAAGVTLWLEPGACLNLNGHQLLNHGDLRLSGRDGQFAQLVHGEYASADEGGRLLGSFAQLQDVHIVGAGSAGALVLTQSVVLDSAVQALAHNIIIDSAWVDSRLDLGTEGASVSTSTFLNTVVTAQEGPLGMSGTSAFSQVNFVHDDVAIALEPSTQDGENSAVALVILDSYINTAQPDLKLVDADDDPLLVTDIAASDFVSTPYLNDTAGFAVGDFLIPLASLGDADSVSFTHRLSVVVEQGVLGQEAVWLPDLQERLVFRDGELIAHTVRYGTLDFNYADIDFLIMTVVRDGVFTPEFQSELRDAGLASEALSAADMLSLMGVETLGAWVLQLAGADGAFVA